MSARYSAARPKRAGETFARAHHGEHNDRDDDRDDEPSASKRVKFDVRNPSALAFNAGAGSEAEVAPDAVLEADVIGKGAGATKRGAVNIDGYDSDSENENFSARAEPRGAKRKGKGGSAGDDGEVDVDIADQLDNYDRNLKNGGASRAEDDPGEGEEDDDDMFAAEEPDEAESRDPSAPGTTSRGKKGKEVRFLDSSRIEGQETTSRSGGHVHITADDSSSDDDSEAVELAIQEEGVDQEVGAGGLKRHAPKIDAFNMKAEQEDGAFDEAGNYIRRAADPDAVHDRWLEGVSKKDMKKAAAAHERREAEARRQRMQDDGVMTADLLAGLIRRLEPGETALEALARLGKGQARQKKVPRWKLKKMHKRSGDDHMDVDDETRGKAHKEPEDPEQARIKQAIGAITEAADRLLGREYPDIYDTEREMLLREYRAEAGEPWMEPPPEERKEEASAAAAAAASEAGGPRMWEYRWTDGRDPKTQGPFDEPTMRGWHDAGYFEGVEFRAVGQNEWSRAASFV